MWFLSGGNSIDESSLESALKKFLILFESRGNKVATSDIANTFKYATDKYAGEILKIL